MVREILHATNPLLRVVSKPIKKIDKKTLSLIKDLKETLSLQKDPEGVGLAAPQVGKNLRLFVIRPKDKIKVIINPEIVFISKEKTPQRKQKIMEGCLSLPHFYGPLVRATKVKIKYQDENGNPQEEEFLDLNAQIILHEIDHLDGILFVDRLLEQKKALFEYKDREWHEVELV